MENVDLAGILRDCMLPLVGSLPTDEWVRAFIDDESTLALLPCLAAACKEWRDVVFELTRFAALRVAMADFMLLKPGGVSRVGSHSRKKEMAWIATKYEGAFFILSCSWALQVDVSKRLRLAPLSDLSSLELQSLCSKLQAGWGVTQVELAVGVKLQPSPRT